MTKEDLLMNLGEECGDPELSHARAEKNLASFLRDNGLADIADAFDDARERDGWWYA